MTESGLNEPFSLFNTGALLGDNRKISALDPGDSPAGGWVVSVQHVAESWAEWRRHADGDAFLFLLWGAAVALSTQDTAEQAASNDLKAASAFIVPSGTWYRLTVEEPANLLTAVRTGDIESRSAS